MIRSSRSGTWRRRGCNGCLRFPTRRTCRGGHMRFSPQQTHPHHHIKPHLLPQARPRPLPRPRPRPRPRIHRRANRHPHPCHDQPPPTLTPHDAKGSCTGCSLSDETTLTCTQCVVRVKHETRGDSGRCRRRSCFPCRQRTSHHSPSPFPFRALACSRLLSAHVRMRSHKGSTYHRRPPSTANIPVPRGP